MATHQQWGMDHRDWQRQGATQLSEALRNLPGVQLRDYGGAGALVSLAARGLGAAHTVVTLDGFPVTDFTSGAVDVGRFRLSDMSQLQWTIADAPALLTSVRTLGTAHLALRSAGEGAVDAIEADTKDSKSLKQLKKYGDNVTVLLDLDAGRLDAAVLDEVVGRYYVAKKPFAYVVLEEDFGTEDYGVGLRKEDTALQEKLSAALESMKKDGKAGQIAKTWFGKDIIR